MMLLKVVVLPAPFLPSRAAISPSPTVSDTLSSIKLCPYKVTISLTSRSIT